MQQSYHHLSSEERAVIQICRSQGRSLRAIAHDIACLLNTRARKRLGWDSPQDRFLAEIEYLKNGVALEC